LSADIDDSYFISESFNSNEQVVVGLDTLASQHLLFFTLDFISEIKPITPLDIHGVGGNIQAIGQDTVRLWFCSPTAESAYDVSPHLDATVTHMRSLPCQPSQNTTQYDYTLWHYKLGHLSHPQMQLLLNQGKL
jgi:hypothetical protein